MTATDAPLNVVIVCDYFLDFVGGAQTSMRQQQAALNDAGHRVVMVSAARGRGARTRRVPSGLQITPAFVIPGLELPVIPNSARTRAILRAQFVRDNIDIVHVQTEFGLAHAAADVAAELGIPVVHTVHTFYWASDDNWHAPLAPVLRFFLERTTGARIPRGRFTKRPVDNLLRNLTLGMARRSDAVISPSAHQGRDLESAGLQRPVTVVPNPIATSPRPPVPLTDSPGTRPRFLWVARCEPIKRPLLFAAAAIDALARTDNGFVVDFVGDGADYAALQRVASAHPELRVWGSLPNNQVFDLMDAASVVVLSSVGFDNQPMTIAESVSRERGILYCDPKLREGLLQAGFLANTPDQAGLADAIVELVQTPGLIAELSRGAALDGAQFSPQNYVARSVAVFRAAAARVR